MAAEDTTPSVTEETSETTEVISSENSEMKGTATVTLRGTGNYGGEITVKFKIEQKNFILRLLGL